MQFLPPLWQSKCLCCYTAFYPSPVQPCCHPPVAMQKTCKAQTETARSSISPRATPPEITNSTKNILSVQRLHQRQIGRQSTMLLLCAMLYLQAALEVQKLHLFPRKSPCSLWHHGRRVVTATSRNVILKGIGQTQTPTEYRIKGLWQPKSLGYMKGND